MGTVIFPASPDMDLIGKLIFSGHTFRGCSGSTTDVETADIFATSGPMDSAVNLLIMRSGLEGVSYKLL